MNTHPGNPGAGRLERTLDFLIRGGLLLILVLAPLPFGSVQPWAYSALELGVALLGLLYLYRLFLFPSTPIRFSALLLAPIGILLLMGLQLIPLSPSVLAAVSPSTAAFYARTVGGYSEETRDVTAAERAVLGPSYTNAERWRPISQDPAATRVYLLKGVAFVLFLFLILNSFRNSRQLHLLLYAFVMAGTFQAFYGLLEYLSGHQHIFVYQKKYYIEAATGTFINRNHFAAFLEMSLLITLGLLFSRLRSAPTGTPWRERLLGLTDRRASLNLTLVLCIGILVIALILSYSRAGIILGLTAAGAFCILQLRQDWSLKKTVLVVLFAVVVIVPAYGVGYWTLTGRYAVLTEEFSAPGGRLAVWRKAAVIVRDFPLLGTGIGTFRDVFPRYREATTRAFYDYTHNDYLQILSEAGIMGGALVALGLAMLGRTWWQVGRVRGPGRIMMSACGLGLLAVVLHETVDFGMQIPANLLAATCLCGCMSVIAGADETRARQGSANG